MDPYLGEVRQVGFSFAPPGWLPCNGQLIAISQYEALYTLLGTTYGGDGSQTFGLPDLRGRAMLCQGTSAGGTYTVGQVLGQESVTLTSQQLPTHAHPVNASATPSSGTPAGNIFAGGIQQYGNAAASGVTANMVTPTGGSQSHSNLMPYQCLNFIIAVEGVFPSSS